MAGERASVTGLKALVTNTLAHHQKPNPGVARTHLPSNIPNGFESYSKDAIAVGSRILW